jgi:hypothetical protein
MCDHYLDHQHWRKLALFNPIRFVAHDENVCQSSNFWDMAENLGDSVRKYTENLIIRAALDSSRAVAVKLHEFEETMVQVVTNAKRLRDDVHEAAQKHGVGLDQVSEKLSSEMAVVLEQLKKEFPSPGKAPSHEERLRMTSHVMKNVEESLVRVCGLYGLPEANVKAQFRAIEPPVTKFLVITGQ